MRPSPPLLRADHPLTMDEAIRFHKTYVALTAAIREALRDGFTLGRIRRSADHMVNLRATMEANDCDAPY